MSVLIRGMEMPKSCKSCDLLQNYDGDMFCPLNNYLNFGDIENVPDYVMDACPLVELPSKHGRLVDADALMEKESTQYSNVMKDGQRDWFDKILADLIHKTLEVTLTEKNAPTVLEAEGVEDDA